MKKAAMLATLGLLMGAAPALAHHPFASEFDAQAPVTLSGTVAKVDWNDPHVVIHVNVRDASGQARMWNMEAGSPVEMQRNGWTNNTLKEGEQITVHGYRAKSEPFTAAARMVDLPDGKKLPSGSNDGGPQQ